MDGILYHILFLKKETRQLKQCRVEKKLPDREGTNQSRLFLNKTLENWGN